MSNEITVQTSLQVVNGNLQYRGQPTSFRADQALARGPTPGMVTATTSGTDVTLTALTTPGLCRIQNYDATNFVEVGIYIPSLFVFLPLMELLPGESYVIRLSRFLGQELGTGTGTGALASGERLRVKANTAACLVLVEAFNQ